MNQQDKEKLKTLQHGELITLDFKDGASTIARFEHVDWEKPAIMATPTTEEKIKDSLTPFSLNREITFEWPQEYSFDQVTGWHPYQHPLEKVWTAYIEEQEKQGDWEKIGGEREMYKLPNGMMLIGRTNYLHTLLFTEGETAFKQAVESLKARSR